MNSFEPSAVVARFRATSRKLFRPKLIFSARIVTNSTSPRFPRVSSSIRSPRRPGLDREGITRPAARDISVPPVRHRFPPVRRPSGRLRTRALNGDADVARRPDGLRPLRHRIRGTLLPELRDARGGASPGAGDSAERPVQPLWDPLLRQVLSNLRPPRMERVD